MAKNKREYTDQESTELVAEIKTGRRVFDTKKGLLQIRFPGVEETRLGEWEYSKVLNQAMLDKIPTNKEMARLIEERNLWGKEEEKKIEKLQEEIQKQILVLEKMSEGSKNAAAVEDKIAEIRNQIVTLQQERQRYFNNTAEAKADEAKMSFLISKCTEYADTGKPLWATYQDFKSEHDQETVNLIVYQFITFINGLPADFLSESSVSQKADPEQPENGESTSE